MWWWRAPQGLFLLTTNVLSDLLSLAFPLLLRDGGEHPSRLFLLILNVLSDLLSFAFPLLLRDGGEHPSCLFSAHHWDARVGPHVQEPNKSKSVLRMRITRLFMLIRILPFCFQVTSQRVTLFVNFCLPRKIVQKHTNRFLIAKNSIRVARNKLVEYLFFSLKQQF